MPAPSAIETFPRAISMIWEPPSDRSSPGCRVPNRHEIELFPSNRPHHCSWVEAMLLTHAHRLSGNKVSPRMPARATGTPAIFSVNASDRMLRVRLAVFAGLFCPRTAAASGEDPPVSSTRSI
jgi:hypothetical protein